MLAWQGYYAFTETTVETGRPSLWVFNPHIWRFMCGLRREYSLATHLQQHLLSSSSWEPRGTRGLWASLLSWCVSGVPRHFLDLCCPIWQPPDTCHGLYLSGDWNENYTPQSHSPLLMCSVDTVATMLDSTAIKHFYHCRKLYWVTLL